MSTTEVNRQPPIQTTLEDYTDTKISDHSDVSDAHHEKYTDSEAVDAVDGSDIDITGDADTVDGEDASHFVQVDGSSEMDDEAFIKSADVSDAETGFYDTYNSQRSLVTNGGDVDVPNGEISEQDERLATRTWTDDNTVDFNGENITVSDTEPNSPSTNDLWLDTSE